MGVFDEAGAWLIENVGVEPDITVDNLPHATFNGGDAQLDAAVSELMNQLSHQPVVTPEKPSYPDKAYHGAVTEACPA